MKKAGFLGVSIVFLSLMCSICLAQNPLSAGGLPGSADIEEPELPAGKWWRSPDTVTGLKLTPEEQSKIDGLYFTHQRKIVEYRGQMATDRFELDYLLEKPEFDEKACMEVFNKLMTHRTEMATERFVFQIEIRKLLGHERFDQLKQGYYDRRVERKDRIDPRREEFQKKRKEMIEKTNPASPQ